MPFKTDRLVIDLDSIPRPWLSTNPPFAKKQERPTTIVCEIKVQQIRAGHGGQYGGTFNGNSSDKAFEHLPLKARYSLVQFHESGQEHSLKGMLSTKVKMNAMLRDRMSDDIDRELRDPKPSRT